MPELPEVEVVRRGLAAQLRGGTLRRVRVREPRLRWAVPEGLDAALAESRLESVGRRGKYLLLRFAQGWLIVHLGMSGSLRFLPGASAGMAGAHDHVDFVFGHGVLRLHDPRRFGAVLWHPAHAGAIECHPLLAGLGVEPFSDRFDAALLHRATRGRRASIKQLLLAGKIVVGVGNIYACESLFRAAIRPSTAAGRIGLARYGRLAACIRETLSEAIERGGSTLRDFVGSGGESGYFQLDCDVYGRAGDACRRCGAIVRVDREHARATYWCAGCQH